tara:strand:- start:1420 stop:2205 length:786 start_codon:yes stop_codon:yes gene_type:complete
MKKNIFYVLIFFILLILVYFLSSKSIRYTGINYSIVKEEISNFKKIIDLFERDKKYQKLVETINRNQESERDIVIGLAKWVNQNIRKIGYDINDDVVDSHPWTIVERKMGGSDQFSDILSVLLIYSKIDSFFIDRFNKIGYPITFFKYNNSWSLIDPYYGIYFLNKKNQFCNLNEHKNKNCTIYHFEYGKISENSLRKIFFNKDFKNLNELENFFNFLLEDLPSLKQINKTNIYEMGGRSYIQKPIHRLLYQIQKSLNLIN